MNKTPISILQEWATRNGKSIPVYNYIGHRDVESNDHEFTMRVTCDNLSADGKGSTKQEAKQNSAKEMLLLIDVPVNNGTLGSNEGNSSIEKELSMDFSLSDVGANYIGLVHEYCTQKRISAPVFTELGSFGPCHSKIFAIQCQVKDIKEEASAKTKKLAKTEAAKKVWLKLSKQNFEPSTNGTIETKIRDLVVQLKETKIENNLSNYKEQLNIAEKKYLDLTKLRTTSISDKLSLNESHRVFTSNSYSISLRQSILTLLGEIDTNNEDIYCLPKYIYILDKVSKLLKVKLEKIVLPPREKTALQYMYDGQAICYKLHTKPLIVSMGLNKALDWAELNAIFDAVISLKILFH